MYVQECYDVVVLACSLRYVNLIIGQAIARLAAQDTERAAKKPSRQTDAPVALAVAPKKADPAGLAATTSSMVKDKQERLHQAMLFSYLTTNLKLELLTYTNIFTREMVVALLRNPQKRDAKWRNAPKETKARCNNTFCQMLTNLRFSDPCIGMCMGLLRTVLYRQCIRRSLSTPNVCSETPISSYSRGLLETTRQPSR